MFNFDVDMGEPEGADVVKEWLNLWQNAVAEQAGTMHADFPVVGEVQHCIEVKVGEQ